MCLRELEIADHIELLPSSHQLAFVVGTVERFLWDYRSEAGGDDAELFEFLSQTLANLWKCICDQEVLDLNTYESASSAIDGYFHENEPYHKKSKLRHLGNTVNQTLEVFRGELHPFELARRAIALAAKPIPQKWNINDYQFWSHPVVQGEMQKQMTLLETLFRTRDINQQLVAKLRETNGTGSP